MYTPGGAELWTADFGIDTNGACLDSGDNTHVAGPRVSDMTLTFPAGGWQITAPSGGGGQFRIAVDGYRTSLLSLGCAASDVQTALAALANIGTGNVTVSGGPLANLGSVIIQLVGSLSGTTPTFTIETYKLTGLPTVKTFKALDGSLTASGYTESTPNAIRYTEGYLYVVCNRSAGLRLVSITANTKYRLQAFGEITGGAFRVYYTAGQFRLEATGDISWPPSASDVQTALNSIPQWNGRVACAGGPLPDAPITITFTTDPTNNFNGAALDIEQGNLAGGLSLYKLNPADLSQVWAVNTGFSTCNVVATDSGGKIYVGGRGIIGSSEVTAKGENKTDSIDDNSDVFVRQYDNSGSPQSLGIENHAANPQACAVDTSGNVFTNSSPWQKLYKLYLTGTVTGGTFQMAYNGSPVLDFYGHPVNFPYNVWASRPGTPFGTGVQDYLTVGVGEFTAIGDLNLSVAPIWIYPNPILQQVYGPLSIYSDSLVGGTVSLDVVNIGQSAFNFEPTDRLTQYDSSGNQLNISTFVCSPNEPIPPTGLAMALDSSQQLCISPNDINNFSVLTLMSNDLQTVIWRAILSGTNETNLPITYGCGFDSSNNVYQGGTRSAGIKSTRKFDSSNPPNLLWERDHGSSLDAGLSVVDLGVTASGGLMTTGVRVKLSSFP